MCEACRRLAERDAGEIPAVAGKIRSVVEVEHLAEERQTPSLSKHKIPTQPHIKRLKIVAKRVATRQSQPRDQCAFAVRALRIKYLQRVVAPARHAVSVSQHRVSVPPLRRLGEGRIDCHTRLHLDDALFGHSLRHIRLPE